MRFLQENGHARIAHNRGKGKTLKWIKDHLSHEEDECLAWPWFKDHQGYGFVSYFGKIRRAHIIMCTLAHGDKPSPTHQAAHSCGNGHLSCVNPKHLSWKTPEENAQDRVRSGNYSLRKGEPRHKLDEDRVRKILALKGERPIIKIAKDFGVSVSTISSIHCGRVWKQVSNHA